MTEKRNLRKKSGKLYVSTLQQILLNKKLMYGNLKGTTLDSFC